MYGIILTGNLKYPQMHVWNDTDWKPEVPPDACME
jgi:hypothetical protein